MFGGTKKYPGLKLRLHLCGRANANTSPPAKWSPPAIAEVLCGERKTQERIQYALKTGKTLRN